MSFFPTVYIFAYKQRWLDSRLNLRLVYELQIYHHGHGTKVNCVLYFPTTVFHFTGSFCIVKWPHCWRVGENFPLPVIPQSLLSVYMHFLRWCDNMPAEETFDVQEAYYKRILWTNKKIESPQTPVKMLNQVDRYLCTLSGGMGEDRAQ